MGKPVYDDSSIKRLKNLDAVRHRSGMYLGNRGVLGQLHMVQEVLDNSRDEHELPTFDSDLPITICYNHNRTNFSCMVKDYGRGIPVNSLETVSTKLHASGKFDTDAYAFSGGLNGVGLKLISALSDYAWVATTHGPDTGVIAFRRGEILYHHTFHGNGGEQGTTVVFSPDTTHFQDTDKFLAEGVPILTRRIKFNGIMSGCNLVFGHGKSLDAKRVVNNCPTTADAVVDYIQQVRDTQIKVEYSKIGEADPVQFIKEEFGNTAPIVWDLQIDRPVDTVMGYDIKLYLPKSARIAKKGTVGCVNTINIDDHNSDHIKGVNDSLKRILERYIDDEDVREYFNALYRIPLYAFVKVQYPSAEFENQTKTSFRDTKFYTTYTALLNRHLATVKEETWLALFSGIEEDINQKYKDHYIKAHGGGKKFTDIDMSLGDDASLFFQCSTTDRTLRELFIVEGRSAFGSAKMAADPYYQSVLAISGKPINGVQKDMKEFLRDRHIANLMTVLGITPQHTTLAELNFNKIFLLMDADPHGEHISTLMTGNLIKLNPLLGDGKLFISNPPLYSLNVNNKTMIYLKDYEALLETRITHVYQKLLYLFVKPKNGTWLRVLGRQYYELCYLVDQVGSIITNAARTISLDDQLCEVLLRHTEYHSGEYHIDFDSVVAEMGADSVDIRGTVAYLSISAMDVIIPLDRYYALCGEGLYHNYNKYACNTFDIGITSINVDRYFETPVLITHLKQLFNVMDRMLGEYEYYKGLGEMNPEDLRTTSFDPATRSSTQITSLGDVTRLFALLGKDSKARKQLVLG